MDHTASATRAEANPRPIPGRIGAVLAVLATLITHARRFAATAATSVAAPEFAPVAAIFGTYDLPVILNRVQRGILRALALQKYLFARAARGRNLRFTWPPRLDLPPHLRRLPTAPKPAPRPAPRPAPAARRPPDPACCGPDDPRAYHLPTQEELEADVRRRPVGRTIAYICMDLGIAPGLCDGAFWNQVEKALRRYGGSLHRLYQIREKRQETFLRERDARPDTWHIDWRDLRGPTVRHVLGSLIGEAASAPPAIVPS